MNARKAKTLRRWALRMTQGCPAVGLAATGKPVRKTVVTTSLDANGKPVVLEVWHPGTLAHKPTTTRKVYQKLKRIYGHSNLGTLK